MNILLTGATGLLGSHILKQGLEHGFTFTIPYRKIKKRTYLSTVADHKKIKLIEQDLTQELNSNLFTNIDIIINCAALLSPHSEDYEAMVEMNVNFPKRLYEAAIKHRVSFFYHISSNSTLGSKDKKKIITEEDTEFPRETNYTKTKKIFDTWLKERNQVKHAIIYPAFILDSFDAGPSSGGIFLALKMGKFNYYSAGIKNIVSATDVARGLYQLIESKKDGDYILSGENIRIEDFLEMACTQVSKNVSDIEKIKEEKIKEYPIEREFCLTQGLSSQKAKMAFSYEPNDSAKDCITRSIDWFKEKKIIRK